MTSSATTPPALDQLRRHARTLLDIRAHVFGQLAQGGFEDAFVLSQLPVAADRRRALMPVAWAVEAATLPLGVLGDVVKDLADLGEFGQAREFVANDATLRQFAINVLRDSDRERKQFIRLFEFAFEPLLANLVAPAEDRLAPYGGHDVLDLHAWRLAALVDLDDVFFMRSAPIDDDARKRHLKLHTVFADKLRQSLKELRGLVQLKGFPESTNLRGWYASPSAMRALDRVTEEDVADAIRARVPGITAPAMETAEWAAILLSILNHQAIIDTTLVSTRAAISVLAVAKATYSEATFRESDDKNFRAQISAICGDFGFIETNLFRSDVFARFILGQFDRVTKPDLLALQDYDTFIHLVGILAAALSHGYFCPGSERETFRASASVGVFTNRTAVIRRILKHLQGGTKAELSNMSGFLNTENWFVSTTDPAVLFDETEGTLRALATPDERKQLGNAHVFQFVLALPLVVKALAELCLQERMFMMTTTKATGWSTIDWSAVGWLAEVESVGAELVAAMTERMVSGTDAGRFATFGGGYDLAATAAVVDALALWSAGLLCRAALNGEMVAQDEPSRTGGVSVGDGEVSPEDQKVVADFFRLLKRHAQPKPALADLPSKDAGATGGPGRGPVVGAESLDLFITTARQCYKFFRPKYDWKRRERDAKQPTVEQVLQVVALIEHVQKGVPEADKADVPQQLLKVLTEATRDGKTEFAATLSLLVDYAEKTYRNSFISDDPSDS